MIESLLASASVATIAKLTMAFAPLLAALGGTSRYKIKRSLRFRASASAYLSRTPAVAGNRTTWTWSGWVKRGSLGAIQTLFGAATGTNDAFGFNASDQLTYWHSTLNSYVRVSSAVFRDPCAWYHLVIAFDSSNASAQSRLRFYVNGIEITSWATNTAISQNLQSGVNSTVPHLIGSGSSVQWFDGYLAHVYFVDGQALDASSFGQIDPVTGQWTLKKYSGSYGASGFFLDFLDNSAATATAIGADRSGNGNNWTPSGISVSAGPSNDSLTDTPTTYGTDTGVGGEVRGNYCTLNPLAARWSIGAATLSDGCLRATYAAGSNAFVFGTSEVSTGKWYWEVLVSAVGTSQPSIGVANHLSQTSGFTNAATYLSDGTKNVNGSISAYGASYTTNDVIGVALDCDAKTVTFYKNNATQGSISIEALPASLSPLLAILSNAAFTCNFGQRPFVYPAPSGFKAICTQNLPNPAIVRPSQYFDVVLAAGASIKSSAEALFAGSDFMEWIKDRATVNNHQIIDTVRGTSAVWQPNTTNAETTYLAPSGNSVAWVWKEGALPGFDIVSYTGTGVARTISHSLGVVPSLILFKNRSSGASWHAVYHASFGSTKVVYLNMAEPAVASAVQFNNTNPTSSVFSVGTSDSTNTNGDGFIAYLFAEVPGFSRFGSYTGNGNTDSPFVWCGFKPRFVMIKRVDVAADWVMWDSARSPFNTVSNVLAANSNAIENSGGSNRIVDFLSNGFKLRDLSVNVNASGGSYVFCAFAEMPFKYALAN